jgi:hypothetical protein
MACWSDEVEHGMNSVVPETGIAFDPRLFREVIIVLFLQISDDLGKAVRPLLLLSF